MTDKAAPTEMVKAFNRLGEKVMVPANQVAELEKLGGRVATKQELAQAKLDAEYEGSSTAQKALGHASTLLGPIGSNALVASGAATVRPGVRAFQSGESKALTLGLDEAATKRVLEETSGFAGAREYGRQMLEAREAEPGFYQAGELAGFAATAIGGGAGGAARAAPGLGVSALGGAAEAGVARALAGVAGRGIAGRAAATAAELGARGAVEGALYGAADQLNEQILGDKELAADKIFAAAGLGGLLGGVGGAALGGAGSLAKSGASAAVDGARGRLSRIMSAGSKEAVRAETAAVEAETKALGAAEKLASDEAATAASKASTEKLAEVSTKIETLSDKASAYARQKSNELAFDALGATKTQARKALEHVAGGADAVGDYVNRIALKPAAGEGGLIGGTLKAGAEGRADNLLATIRADKYGRVADGLSSAIKATPARVDLNELYTKAAAIDATMRATPSQVAGADSFRNRIVTELGALNSAGKVAADGTVDAADIFYTRASLAKNAYELGQASGSAGDAYKSFLREMDDASLRAIDDAAAKAGKSGVRDEIKHWKREWQLASAAEKAAEGGAEKVAHNNTFGLREGIGAMVGMATGNPLLGLATGIGGKLARERGAAAGAALLSRMADMGVISRAVQAVDEVMGKAAKGLTSAPVKGRLPERMTEAPRKRAQSALARVSDYQADPEAFAEKLTRNTEAMSVTAPELAGGVAKRMTDAMAFLASKAPVQADHDPLDPHPAPRMSESQAREFALYDYYAERPSRFFEEAAHGKLTPEGAETAKALMPKAFAELQTKLLQELAERMANGGKVPYIQRLRIGAVMDIPADPSQRKDHMLFLQNNLAQATTTGPEANATPDAGLKRRPLQMKTTTSTLDRLESK